MGAVAALPCGIGAGSGPKAWEHAYCKRQVSGSNPLCGLQIRDIDLDQGFIHVAFNYVVKGGKKIRKDTKTHQDRWLAIGPDTCALIASYLEEVQAALAGHGRRAGRGCIPVLQRPGSHPAMEPGLGNTPHQCRS
jgi:integrase